MFSETTIDSERQDMTGLVSHPLVARLIRRIRFKDRRQSVLVCLTCTVGDDPVCGLRLISRKLLNHAQDSVVKNL